MIRCGEFASPERMKIDLLFLDRIVRISRISKIRVIRVILSKNKVSR